MELSNKELRTLIEVEAKSVAWRANGRVTTAQTASNVLEHAERLVELARKLADQERK